jgi:hypothetical protein
MNPDEYEQLPWDTRFESSNINRIAFVKDDPEDYSADSQGTLYVEFAHGGAYRYEDVTYQAHTELLEADSVGGYLNEHIKPYYDCERISVE